MRKAAIFAAVCVAAWARLAPAQCLGDFNGDGKVSVDELVTAVDNALNGCQISGTRFVDNGDGTLTDRMTGLMWEQKRNLDGVDNDADPHDANNVYALNVHPGLNDGTAYTDFLAKLNKGVSGYSGNGTEQASTVVTGCFADHCDWRLPTVVELEGIVDTTQGACGGGTGACIDPAFGPTQEDDYWSSIGFADNPVLAWAVSFGNAPGGFNTDLLSSTNTFAVRAVRGGS